VSDEREGAGSADDTGTDADGSGGTKTAVVTRPLRPTGKRSRRGAVGAADDADTSGAAETSGDSAEKVKKDSDKAKKKAKKAADGPSRNPIMFVINYLKQVVGELRKVIWPNRKQMVTYTTVVLAFLAFMVALISGVDLGLAKLVMLVFGS
jgi:preprotein translocase subunit SecE